jgi:hypothetical protein
MGALDWANYERQKSKQSENTINTSVDAAKTAEAIRIVGAEQVAARGGVNAQGYFNDVPAYQQLTANERKSVTLANGHIDSMGMLAILNRKEAEHFGRSLDSGVIKANAPASVSITATPPSPEPEMFSARMFSAPPVKTATIDIILFDDETTPIDTMADLIFENIGGQELINITRSDIVNGQKISYQPIKNLSSIQQRYNPNNILSLQQTADKYFAGFSIKLEDKIPNEGNGINGENVYIEESTGDLILEFININNDEQIEIQITTDGTIYEADLGEIAS